MHVSKLSIHPNSIQMYHDLRHQYWWPSMKMDIVEYVFRCLMCEIIQVEHQKPSDLLKGIPILVQKWEHVTMNFTFIPKLVGSMGELFNIRGHIMCLCTRFW